MPPLGQFSTPFNALQPRQQSNNAGFQNILGRFDPYRGQRQSATANQPIWGAGQGAPTYSDLLQNLAPGSTAKVAPDLQGSFTEALAPYQPFTPGGQTGVFPALLDYIRGLGTGGTTAQPPAPTADVIGGGGVQTTPELAAAARLLGGATATNPFIDPAGRERLQGGLLPELNAINPAFYRYTSPLITQAMQGLFQSGGVPLAHQRFLQEMFRPPGI